MTVYSRPNPDDAGPIIHRRMGILITARCDTAWSQTRDCSDTSCTEMQCLRPLRHSGALFQLIAVDVLQFGPELLEVRSVCRVVTPTDEFVEEVWTFICSQHPVASILSPASCSQHHVASILYASIL